MGKLQNMDYPVDTCSHLTKQYQVTPLTSARKCIL